MINLFDLGRKK